jgi:hypothetical protein
MTSLRTTQRPKRRLRAAVPGVACALAFALAFALPARAQDGPMRLDGLAAVVGGTAPGPEVDVVLRSDVELRARITLGPRAHGLPPGQLPATLLQVSLREIIGELLIAREARRVQATSPSAEDVERERRRLEQSAGGPERLGALLKQQAADPSEVLVIARRRAQVVAFLSANLEGASVVTDSEVERAFAEDPARYQGRSLSEVREALRARLSARALEATIERWVHVLEARTATRVFADYST